MSSHHPDPIPVPAQAQSASGVSPPDGILLGIGRSGFVFKSRDGKGRMVARKVFDSSALTRAVQYIFLGSANPYAWNADAVQCAVLRRHVLARLVEYWFGSRLRVARATGSCWNDQFSAFELSTEFVDGRAPTLSHPLNRRGADELEDLRRSILPTLREHLLRAGFPGALWQAGLGNPTALANFLLEESKADGGAELRWAWIDIESGVPALFPAHIPSFWKFYLPRALRLGRPLFDDVDTAQLEAYVRSARADLDARLGAGTTDEILRDVCALDAHQTRWKGQPRVERSLQCALRKGRIDETEVAHYRRRPLRWYAREALRAARGVTRRARRWTLRKWSRAAALPWRVLPVAAVRFMGSQAFREQLAQRFVASRIHSWERRGQLTAGEAEALRERLENGESSSYLTDFGVHIALKPIVKTIEWTVFPTLFATGRIDEALLGAGVLLGGSVVRTLYTSGRLIQAALLGHELPWIALWTGVLPVAGNLAYPLQIVSSSRHDEDVLAQFILYDGCSVIGARLPIWGGRDTLTEHVFNHIPNRVIDRPRGPSERPGSGRVDAG